LRRAPISDIKAPFLNPGKPNGFRTPYVIQALYAQKGRGLHERKTAESLQEDAHPAQG